MPDAFIGHTIRKAERVRIGPRAVGRGYPAHQRQADLRAEARPQPQRILHRISTALRQVEAAQVRIDLFEVGDRRHQARLQRFDGEDILDTRAHGVTGVAFRVGDDNLIGCRAEDVAQRVDLGLRATAARRRVGLVRDKDRLWRDVVAVDAPLLLGLDDQVFHHVLDVADIEPRAVEGAVGRDRAQHLGDGPDAALANRLGALDHDGRRAHANDHPVTPTVERQRGFFDHFVGGGSAGGQEARADPVQQVVRRDVVRGDDDHTPAPPGADPVLRQSHGLGRRGTGRVDLRVRPARTDVLGELRMAHRQDAEHPLAVEAIRFFFKPRLQFVDAPVDFAGERVVAVGASQACAQALEVFEPLAQGLVGVEVFHLLGEGVVAGEGRGEDHPRLVAQCARQHPAFGQLRVGGGVFIMHRQRHARVAQGVDARTDAEPVGRFQRVVPFGGIAEVFDDVEFTGASGEFDDLGLVLDDLEMRLAVFGFDEARDVFIDHIPAQLRRDHVDELIAVQERLDVRIVEDLVAPRQAEAGPADDNGLLHPRRSRCRTPFVDLPPPVEEVGEEFAEFDVFVLPRRRLDGRTRCRRGLRRDRFWRRRWCRGWCGFGLRRLYARRRDHRFANTDAMTRSIQAAQRVVERHHVALLGMVGEEGRDFGILTQNIFGKAPERLLRAGFYEDPHPRVIERLQALNKLHRRGHLLAEDVDHLGDDVGMHRVEIPGDVGDDRASGRLEVEFFEVALERFAGRRYDGGVESMADRDRPHVVAGLRDDLRGFRDARRRAADDRLAVAVDVGDDDVALYLLKQSFHFFDGCEDRRHQAVVFDRHLGHGMRPRADGLERIGKGQGTGGHECAVFAEAVAHHHVRHDAIGGHHPRERVVGGEHGRLGDFGLPQIVLQLLHRRRVVHIDKDVIAQRLAEDRRHDLVGLFKGLRDEGIELAEVVQHVGVLRALTGVKERHLGCRSFAPEDALRTQRFPHAGMVGIDGFERPFGFGGQFGGIAVVDGEAYRSAEVRLSGRRGFRRAALIGLLLHLREAVFDVFVGGPANHHRAP